MKNIILSAVLLGGLTFSCVDDVNEVSLEESGQANGTSVATAEAGIKFKHNGCNKAFGICFTKPIGKPKPKPPKPLFSIAEEEEGWGGAVITIKDDILMIEPYRRAHTDEMIVPISEHIEIDPLIAEELGYNAITLLPGEYEISFDSENEWGKITVAAEMVR